MLIVSIAGCLGYEVNRLVIDRVGGNDLFGTFGIFAFGGFMGLGMGLILRLKERKKLIYPNASQAFRMS